MLPPVSVFRDRRSQQDTAAALFHEHADDPRFPALIVMAVSLIQGLVLEIPIAGRKAIDARWRRIKPVLIEAAGRLLDG